MCVDGSNDKELCRHCSVSRKSLTSDAFYPEWFPVNVHLAIFQRKPTPSIRACISTAFMRNSETCCIWTHAIAFCATVVLYCAFLRMPSENFAREWEEKVVISVAFLCTCACYLLSTIFHIFYCHSMKVYERCLQCDLIGIALGVKGHFIPWIYYSFYCNETLRNLYLVLVVLNGVGGTWALTRGHLLREEKATDRARITLLFFLVCCPGYARILYRDGALAAWQAGHSWAIVGMVMAGIGVVIFCAKIPECFFSGRYNNMMTSHAIFHIFTTLSSWSFLAMSISFSKHRLELGESCFS